MRLIVVVVLGVYCAFASGCVSVPTVAEAAGEDRISTFKLTCKKPYELTQDCSIWRGAGRKVDIDGQAVRVAASEDGRVILVMDPYLGDDIAGDSAADFFALNSPAHSRDTNSSFVLVRDYLLTKGLKLNRVVPVGALSILDGYVIELDADGYSYLKQLPETH